MRASREPTSLLRDEDLIDLFSHRLPELLQRRPDLEPKLFDVFLKTFARRQEIALVVTELRGLRTEVDQRFEQVDRRFDQVDERFDQLDRRFDQVDRRFDQVDERLEKLDQRIDRFRAEALDHYHRLERAIDRLGARWGIRNESLFRRTIAELLEKSFGVAVTQRSIAGEQFDVVIHDHQHVLVEIAASVGPTIQTRLERKQRLYEEATGTRPARVILATASIHSARAHRLQQAGIEVIEPEEIDDSPE